MYAPRSELETRQPCACVARQAVRRLVSLGFNLDNLKNSFRADPNYEIPANVFLQDMTQVSPLEGDQVMPNTFLDIFMSLGQLQSY